MEKKQRQLLSQAVAVTLIRLREHYGLSQLQLAERSGLTRQYISMVERQMRMPHLDTWIQICKGLNVNERDFMLGIQVYMTSPEFSRTGYCPPPPVPILDEARTQAIQARKLAEAGAAPKREAEV